MTRLPEHPITANYQRFGQAVFPEALPPCRECGDASEVWSEEHGYLCADCALERWPALSRTQQLEKLGFEFLDT